MRRIASLLAALAGCSLPPSGDDPSGDDPTPSGDDPTCTEVFFADTDGDGHGDAGAPATACSAPSGYVATDDDCDDSQFGIHPGADELCNDLDDDCDTLVDSLDPSLVEGTVWYEDGDADGYGDPATGAHACEEQVGKITDGTDCDDADPAVHPSANEVCNGKDDDCDTRVDGDDGALVDGLPFYADADGDGLGDGEAVVTDCSVPTGYVDNAEDCDDGDATIGASPDYYEDYDGDGYGDGEPVHTCTPDASLVTVDGDCRDTDEDVHPGATEICDSFDNNCDGLWNDDDPLVVAFTWYGDDDGDGYGDPLDTLASCEGGPGYVWLSTDCDDADAELHPGATEYCDGVDNDCDGTTDDAVVYSDWYPDDDGDGYGADDATNDCVAPSGYIAVGGDCDDTSSTTHPGATEVCANGADDNCDDEECEYAAALADFLVVGSAWEWFAVDLDVADVDGDGVSDLLVGSVVDLALYVVYGPASGTTTTSSLVALRGDSTIPSFGDAIGTGDSNDDGVDDVLAGSSYIDSIGTSYLFLGPITADRDETDADAVFAGPLESLAGCTLDVAGDFDGDGASDVALGAPGGTGVAYVVTGPTSGAYDLATDAGYVYEGASWTWSVGDMNGDGIDDLAVDGDALYLIDGGSAPGTYAADLAASASLTGPDEFGLSMKSVDYDADGTLDLVVGAGQARVPERFAGLGEVFAFLGPLSGSLDGHDAAVIWVPGDTASYLGADIAVGDVDGDESPDLLFGAPWTADGVGEAFLQVGPAAGIVDVTTLPTFRGDDYEELGAGVAIVPDWTGDGRDEVAIATPYHRDAAFVDLIGAVWVFDSETIFGP